MPRFSIGGPGLLVRGTIDIDARPVVRLANGKIATVDSVSFTFRSNESTGNVRIPDNVRKKVRHFDILIPQVVGNRVVSARAALGHALGTGLHLGVFDTPAHANSYAVRLHREQARFYQSKRKRARARG